MDDIIILAKDEDEALKRLRVVLGCAATAGLEIKWTKCKFLKRNIEFLGHVIENGSERPSTSKSEAVQRFPEPKNVKHIQSFLGLTGYFRKFIEGYALIAKPFSDLLRDQNEFVFGDKQKEAFLRLQKQLSDEPVLKLYDQDAYTELHTDACEYGFGAMLLQRNNDDQLMHPVKYMPLKTSQLEQKYDAYTLEALAIVKAVAKFRRYLLDINFKIVTDCEAFTKTMAKKDLIPKIARWTMDLQEFDYSIEHRAGSRMKHVDSLSRNAVMIISDEENIRIQTNQAQAADDDLKPIFKILET